MCARFSLTSPIEAIRQLFNFAERPNLRLSYNIAPTHSLLALRKSETSAYPTETFFAQWGLIPAWSKDPAIGSKLINARSETLDQKPSFKQAFQKRRCLIPANGFFEWQKQADGEKQPYYFTAEQAPLFTFAGLWESWQSPDKNVLETCTILTQPATPEIAQIHSRMPVTVMPEFADQWLMGTDHTSFPPLKMQHKFCGVPVSKKVGNVRENNADLINEISLPQKPVQGSLF